jgi:hypothetical protein
MNLQEIETSKKVFKILIDLGLTGNKLLFCMAQILHETDRFRSKNFRNNNNVGGLNWAGQKNAVKGNFVGAEYNGADGYYAKFNTVKDGVTEYYGLLKRRYFKALEANTPFEFAQALKEKGYYNDKKISKERQIENYSNAIKNWVYTIKKIGLLELVEEKKSQFDNTTIIYKIDNFLGDLFKK